jgi:hypothetical protein
VPTKTKIVRQAGDKCPRCKEGLIVRTELGFECDECTWNENIEELLVESERRKVEIGDYKFKPFSLRIRVEDPEEGEYLLQGCIVARSNNDSPHFQDMIDGINGQLEGWRAQKLRTEIAAREAGGNGA